MREIKVEGHLKESIESRWGKCYKYTGEVGMPDRVCCFPSGKLVWVETKAPGKTLTKLQPIRFKELRAINQDVRMIDTKLKVDIFIREAEMKGWFNEINMP
jgi:hypothetical protein